MRSNKRITVLNIFSILLAVVILLCICLGVVFIVKQVNSTLKTLHPTFVRGALDEEGKDIETNRSIVTQSYFQCRGLQITRDDSSLVSYEVFFYDLDKQFLSSTGVLEDVYECEDMPSHALYARVVITPSTPTDISIVDVWTYAEQITIKVARNQDVEVIATFEFGDKDATQPTFGYGSLVTDEYMNVRDGDWTLTLRNLNYVYANVYDGAGNCCLKLGNDYSRGSLEIVIPNTKTYEKILYVVVYVAGYRNDVVGITAGSDEVINIDTELADTDYVAVKIPVEVGNNYKIATVKQDLCCMISKIEFCAFAVA